MIEALDHIVLAAPSPDAAVADYQALLGLHAGDASFQLANVRLEVRAGAEGHAEGLAALAFATPDGAKAQRLLQQRALPVAAEADGTLRIAPPATHGVAISLVPRTGADPPRSSPPVPGADEASCVCGPRPRGDSNAQSGARRRPLRRPARASACGSTAASRRGVRGCCSFAAAISSSRSCTTSKSGLGDGPDRLWGLSWRVPDVAKAHARLRGAGVEVSDIRTGRRPGTRGLHREEPHGERADADARRCARMKRKRPLARPPRIDQPRGAVTGSGGTWPSRCCW